MDVVPTAVQNVDLDKTNFLDWFARTFNAPVVMSRIELGEISYYRAFAIEEAGPTPFVSTGRGSTPIEASVKAAGEFIERKVYLGHHRAPTEQGSCWISPGGDLVLMPNIIPAAPPPRCIDTSNGWAVHPHRETAIRNALMELIERHCLILSFLKSGWGGFLLINEVEVKGTRLLSSVARWGVGGHRAGLILGILPLTGGIGLGYMADRTSKILTSMKWQHAFFEAYDNIETFNPTGTPRQNSLEAIYQEYLTEKFENEIDLVNSGDYSDEDLDHCAFQLFVK